MNMVGDESNKHPEEGSPHLTAPAEVQTHADNTETHAATTETHPDNTETLVLSAAIDEIQNMSADFSKEHEDAPTVMPSTGLTCDVTDADVVEIPVKVVHDDDGDDDGDDDDGDDDDGEGSNNDSKDGSEDEDIEMSTEDMNIMYNAVKSGDIDLLDDLLDKPGADISMEWFSLNLLMVAIRMKQSDMALFLIDNGVDYNYETMRMDKSSHSAAIIEWYTTSCRQMAYEAEQWAVVDAIDEKNGDLWPNQMGKPRIIRYKKPLEVKLREQAEKEELERLKELQELEAEQDNIDGEEIDTISIDGTDIEKCDVGDEGEGSESRQCDTRNILDSKQRGSISESRSVHLSKSQSCEDVSSGYSTQSSCESQHDTSCRRSRVRTPFGFRQTKSALARLTTSMLHISGQLQPDLPPIRPTSERGSYRRESKLWCASTPTFNGWTVDERPIDTKSVTYCPWKSENTNACDIKLRSRSEYNISGRSAKSCTQEAEEKHEIPYVKLARGHTVSLGCLTSKKATDTTLLRISSTGTTSNCNKLNISSISLDIPRDNVRPRSGSYKSRPSGLVTKGRAFARCATDTKHQPNTRTVNLASLIRHRGLNNSVSTRIEHVLPDRKYSPAGHLRVRSAKGAR